MLKSLSYRLFAAAFLAAAVSPCLHAQVPALQLANELTTLAGTGTASLYGDGGPAMAADLNQPQGLAADSARNLYIADTGNSVVRRIDSITGKIATVAGNGTPGYAGDGGSATAAQLNGPVGVALDANGDLYIADTGNSRVRVVYEGGTLAAQLIALENPSVTAPVVGDIYTVAGSATPGYSGDLGLASLATLGAPQHIAVDTAGDLYFGDTANNRVRVVYLGGATTSALIKAANPSVTTPVAGDVYTAVGSGVASSTGDGAVAGLATVNAPSGIAVDPLGNLFIAESVGNRVRVVFASGTLLAAAIKVDAAGAPTAVATDIYTLIGTGSASYAGDGGLGSAAAISQPAGLFVDSAEDIYLADGGNHVVRLLTAATGVVSTIAGNNGLGGGYSGDEGLATAAQLGTPTDVAVDAAGRVLIADGIGNSRIRVASTNAVLPTTAVGSTSAAQTLLLRVNASIQLAAIAPVPSMGGGTEYTAALSPNCPVGTQLSAGTLCMLTVSFTPAYPGQRSVPLAVTDSNGNVYSFLLSGTGFGARTVVLPGQMTTIAGTGVPGFAGDNGPATAAKLNIPGNVAVDSAGNIFFSDKSNDCIRVIYAGGPVVARLIKLETGYTATAGSIYTIAGIGGSAGSTLAPNNVLATSSKLWLPTNMAIDAADNVYFTEGSKAIRMVNAQTGLLSTIVGNGSAGFAGDNGLGTNAELFLANGIGLDNLGNLYLVDGDNYRIRKVVLSTGVITTIAGTGTTGYSGDGGPAIAAKILLPQAVAADLYGNVYIADAGGNERIRVIYGGGLPGVNPLAQLIAVTNPAVTAPVQGYMYTVAGNGTASYSGDGGLANAAKIDFPYSLAVDAAGNIYFPDEGTNHVRRVDAADGIIRTVGGYAATVSPFGSAAGDGGVATSAYLNKPYGVAVDPLGNLYIADGSNYRIRLITNTAYPLTFASTAVGSTSPSQTVTAVSIGNAAYDFSGFGITGQFAQVNSGTASIPECTLAAPLLAGDSCTAALTFSPHSDGAVTGTAVFAGSAPTQTVQLTGTGTGGTASTMQLTLAGSAVYGSTVPVTATVTAGGAPVTSGNVVFSNGSVTIATVSLGSAGTASATLPYYPVGNETITATYSAAGTLNLQSSASSTIQITVATLTVTANNGSLVYGDPVPALTYTLAGFVNGDSQSSAVTGAPLLSTTATSASANGQYPITVAIGTLSAANYSFTLVNGTMTVSGATAQTIAFAPIGTQIYGAAPLPLAPTSTSGLPVTLSLISGPATLSGNTVTITGAGTVVLEADQAGNSVYRKAQPVQQSFLVTPAALSIAVANASRAYGSSNPAFTGTVTGLVNGDTLGSAVIVTYSTTAVASSPVGQYPVTATVAGLAGGNYSPSVAQATLTVNRAPLTVTVANASRAYGSANPSFTASVTGLVNGDAVGIDLFDSFSTAATVTSDVGSYPITVAIGGSSAAEYSIQIVPGTLSVTAVPLSLTADSFTRLYGVANPVFTGTVTGAVNGDSLTESFMTTATLSSNSGRYAIVPTVTGPKLGDYAVTAANGTLQIELANSQLSLTLPSAAVNAGSAVILSATASTTTSGTPTGSVTFSDGSAALATVALVNGTATYTTSGLLVGSHSISASYAGDYNFYGSSVPPATVAVIAAGYTLTPSANSIAIASGGNGSVTVQVAGVGGYTGSIQFACSGLAMGISCSFSPATVVLTATGPAQQTVLNIGTVSSRASLHAVAAPGHSGSLPYMAVAPGLLAFAFMRRRHRTHASRLLSILALLPLLCVASALSGCGASAPPQPTQVAPGTYSISIQAEAANGSSNSFELSVTIK